MHFRFQQLLLAFLIIIANCTFSIDLNNIYKHIKTVEGGIYAKYDGVTYSSPQMNILRSDQIWLLQTPNLWGYSLDDYVRSKSHSKLGRFDPTFKLPICLVNSDCVAPSLCKQAYFTANNTNLCVMPEHDILNNLAKNITAANYSVDIVQLGKGGITTGEFTDAIKNSLNKLAQKSISLNHQINIRLLEGSYIPFTQSINTQNEQISFETLYQYLTYLTKNLPANNKLRISVATMRSCEPGYCDEGGGLYFDFAWNHGKITNVDNRDIIVGGENYWGDVYLGDNPINDSSIEIVGPIAQSATKYANILWDYVNKHKNFTVNYCYTYVSGRINNSCLVNIPEITKSKPISTHGIAVKAMAVAKLNHKVLDEDADQSGLVQVYAFKNAESSIKMSQQALFVKSISINPHIIPPTTTVDGDAIQALAYAIHINQVQVSIITSNLEGNAEANYSSTVPLEYVYNAIKANMIQQFPKIKPQKITEELNRLLHLATIDFNGTNNTNISSHNKLWMIDDHIFYQGSHNIYPSSLQEYGIIVDSVEAAKEINVKFWDPMWKNANPMKAN